MIPFHWDIHYKNNKIEIILLFVETYLFHLFKYRQFEVFTSFTLPFCVKKTCDDSVMIIVNYIITIFRTNKRDEDENYNRVSYFLWMFSSRSCCFENVSPSFCYVYCCHRIIFISVFSLFYPHVLVKGGTLLAQFKLNGLDQALGFYNNLILKKGLLVCEWRSLTTGARCNTGHCENTDLKNQTINHISDVELIIHI